MYVRKEAKAECIDDHAVPLKGDHKKTAGIHAFYLRCGKLHTKTRCANKYDFALTMQFGHSQ